MLLSYKRCLVVIEGLREVSQLLPTAYLYLLEKLTRSLYMSPALDILGLESSEGGESVFNS